MLDSLLLMCHYEGFLLPSWRKIYCSRIEARLNNFLMTFLQGVGEELEHFPNKNHRKFSSSPGIPLLFITVQLTEPKN